MSTKIYYACRMPFKVFTPVFLPAFHKCVFKAATAHVKSLMPNVPISALKKLFERYKEGDYKLTYKKFLKDKDSFTLRIILQQMVDASKSKLRLPDCIDCSLNVWLYGNHVYTIMYGEYWLWDKFKFPDKVEDYCYWNSTDKPDDVTQRQWDARRDTWDKVCLNSWDAGRMTHDVINASEEIGLLPIAERIVGKKKAHYATWLL